MALMTVVDVRKNVETGLEDDALQIVMDAVEEDIDQRHGAVLAQVDSIEGKSRHIFTTRPIGTITAIVERIISTDTTLATNDYVQRHTKQLERLDTGTNARRRWGDRVTITYVPTDTTSRRKAVYIKLIKLEIEYSGVDSSREGDFSSKALDITAEREKLLASLAEPGGFI